MAHKKGEDIVFRRIRGRVVPIRRKKTKEHKPGKNIGALVTGATITSAGVGTALAGGVASRKFLKRSRKLKIKAFRARGLAELAKVSPGRGPQLSLFGKEIGRKKATKLLIRARALGAGARVLRRASVRSRAFSIAAGGALIGTGLETAFSGPIKSSQLPGEVTKDFILNLGAGLAAAAFVVGRGKVKAATLKKLFKRIKK